MCRSSTGRNHDEERLFVDGLGLAVSGGTFVLVPAVETTEEYQDAIASMLGVSDGRAAEIAAEYPLATYPTPKAAISALVGDANFACTALQLDRWTSARVPTFAYEFNDDDAPQRYAPPGAVAPVATHSSELQYLFDLPNAPVPGGLDADQEALAADMRAAWVRFAGNGNPSTAAVPWPPVTGGDPRDVARGAAAGGRDGLRRAAPLHVLACRIVRCGRSTRAPATGGGSDRGSRQADGRLRNPALS